MSCFAISVAPSINRPESSSSFTNLITLSIFSFKMKEVDPFPALTSPFPLNFYLKLSITDDKLL